MQDESIEGLTGGYGIYARLNGYRMIPVWQKTTPEIRQHILALWQRNGVVIPGDASARAKQAVFMVLGQEGELVAVNTAYTDTLLEKGIADAPSDAFYFYRMFIQPHDRVFNLAKQMIVSTFDYLRDLPAQEAMKGVIMVAENRKLVKRAVQRGFLGIGWQPVGHDQRGNMVLRRDF